MVKLFAGKNLRWSKSRVRDGDPDLLRVVNMPTGESKLWGGTSKLPDPEKMLIAVLMKHGEIAIELGLLEEAEKCEISGARSGGEIVLGFRHVSQKEYEPDPRHTYLEKTYDGNLSDMEDDRKMIIELTPVDDAQKQTV